MTSGLRRPHARPCVPSAAYPHLKHAAWHQLCCAQPQHLDQVTQRLQASREQSVKNAHLTCAAQGVTLPGICVHGWHNQGKCSCFKSRAHTQGALCHHNRSASHLLLVGRLKRLVVTQGRKQSMAAGGRLGAQPAQEAVRSIHETAMRKLRLKNWQSALSPVAQQASHSAVHQGLMLVHF